MEPSRPSSPSALTSKQRAELRSAAHPLEPVVHLGKEGVTPAFLHMLSEAFRTRELLKVRVLEAAPQGAKEMAAELAQTLVDTHIVQVLGRVVTLFRPNAAMHAPRPEAPFAPAAGRPVKKPTKKPTAGAGRRSSGKSGRRGAAR